MPHDGVALPATPRLVRHQVVPSGLFAMLLAIGVEVMFFTGLVSGYLILKASARPGMWPPPDSPTLPAQETLINTFALMASGVFMVLAERAFTKDRRRSLRLLMVTMLLGGAFVALQGVEWVALIARGLTLTSNTQGSFFYTIVGTHAAHAVVALGALAYVSWRLHRGRLLARELWTAEALWLFVVGLWPLLYWQVYW